MKTQHLLFCLFGVLVVNKMAYADVNIGKQIPSVNQVIDALSPTAVNPDAPQASDTDYEGDVKKGDSRSIDMSRLNAAPTTTTTTTKKTKLKKQPLATPRSTETAAALSMEIIFGYKSAHLTADAEKQLKPVGEALASGKLTNLKFVVEGHTDAVGGQNYNKTLSEERAAAVKQFLVNGFHLDPNHIQIIGKGKNDLLDPTNPASEVNRRVRIVAIK